VSSGARIILIVFGGLAVLIVGGVVLLFALAGRMAQGMSDPAQTKRIAASFGTFDAPPGYRATAIDGGLVKTLVLDPASKLPHDEFFSIYLMRMDYPRLPGMHLPEEVLADHSRDPVPLMGLPHCKRTHELASERIRSRIGSLLIRRAMCAEPGNAWESATARIPHKGGNITVSASGTHRSFDIVALRTLLASFR
jgi:hypothetical protein